ncbi:MAG TPA: isoprenylcysteine carboxylmethyltransferase family protein [Tepidisphaeraceae bacterium]|jgi:protein-S-isoprenylcysteine O-methyltransferase Ste14|nr:isoprenylcysteine carboxylmethyltransferase family protein [Tepidisphaeraceae bacterium]
MKTEDMFNMILWTLLASMLLMRGGFAFRVWRTGERLLPDRAAKEREGWPARSIEGLCSILLVAVIVNFCFPGDRLRAFAFPAPPWLRWTGLVLGVASVGLFAWTHVALGKFWSTCLQLRTGHRLITAGPYARIRHPMYSAILGWMTSLALVAGSWVPLVFAGLAALNFILRIQPEEKMMLQAFGDEYRAYMKRTGRLLPVY